MISKAILISLLVFIVGAAGFQLYRYDITSFDALKEAIMRGAQDAVAELPELLTTDKEVITPPPLRGSFDQEAGILTTNGVFVYTNEHRANNGASALARNTTLDAAATNKLNDMFQKQYFDHVSPDGKGPAEVVEGVQYEYIRVGENLALGNFESDKALVQAWMDSPGHRANIVSPGFTEIGIAVGQGMFEGNRTWLAVQTFGTPITACSKPSDTTLQTIEQLQAQRNTYQAQLTALQQQISTTNEEVQSAITETERLSSEGNAKIDEGNRQIEEGNRVYEETGSEEEAQPYWDKGKQLQEEGRQLLQQAEAKQDEAQRLEATYEQVRREYNDFVSTYNTNADRLEVLTKEYNQWVRTFNQCVENFSS